MWDFDFQLLNRPIDVSKDFSKIENTFFIASRLVEFNSDTASGIIEFRRNIRKARMDFNQVNMQFEESSAWEFPPVYEENFKIHFSLTFISSRTLRFKMQVREKIKNENQSLMLEKVLKEDKAWDISKAEGYTLYKSENALVKVVYEPFNIEIRDSKGKLLTKTNNIKDTKCLENANPVPLSFVRRAADLKRTTAASFLLSQDEKIYGCGESFTRLNKRGQKIVLYSTDAHGVQIREMYKPIPFFLSSRGYGMFAHTSAPMTFDFGNMYDQANVLYFGDEQPDLFIFAGNPKEVLSEYTSLTGRSPLPPLWSFGLWMSRITYKSEEETRGVADKLREHKIPCDVIHLDTGWFETDWCCDYKFSKTRFDDPRKMISDLKSKGFHISLWQLPYFSPNNELYKAAIEKGYFVLSADGGLPTEDAIIDFSNPEAVEWYQGLLKNLFEMGADAIKVDFGEGAPLQASYASGKSGFYEHNLYPLRYNKAVADLTKQCTGEHIIWGRSAWAGSQRYPLHWGGDAENTDSAMAATLRGGLSLGLSGFSFWSHDIGGFVQKSPEELYNRWLPFGMLTSHSRCHGEPPKEPWAYSEAFLNSFRRTVNLKYSLMPYVYAQAKISSDKGLPMLRALFLEYPEDNSSWFIEDEYLFGSDFLIAPIFEENILKREVYLPSGTWIDYQTEKIYEGEKWHTIEAGIIPAIILVRDGTVIPHAETAQSTDFIDWNNIEFVEFNTKNTSSHGYLFIPGSAELTEITLKTNDGKYIINKLPEGLNCVIRTIKGKV